MRDRDVRGALYDRLHAEHAAVLPQTRFVDELDLCGRVRVDVAVVNGELAGYELKSARDTLQRLPQQVAVYSRVLDRATAVVAERHLSHARETLPVWWGVIVATVAGGPLALHTERVASPNPAIDPTALVQLLWRDEVLDYLAMRGLDHGVRGASRARLWDRLARSVPLDELRLLVRERLKIRTGWRSAPPRAVGDA